MSVASTTHHHLTPLCRHQLLLHFTMCGACVPPKQESLRLVAVLPVSTVPVSVIPSLPSAPAPPPLPPGAAGLRLPDGGAQVLQVHPRHGHAVPKRRARGALAVGGCCRSELAGCMDRGANLHAGGGLASCAGECPPLLPRIPLYCPPVRTCVLSQPRFFLRKSTSTTPRGMPFAIPAGTVLGGRRVGPRLHAGLRALPPGGRHARAGRRRRQHQRQCTAAGGGDRSRQQRHTCQATRASVP